MGIAYEYNRAWSSNEGKADMFSIILRRFSMKRFDFLQIAII